MTEYMDIVDEDDVVIGRDTRENVHRDHAIHRGVHILVVTSAGLLVVQKRSASVDYYPGYLDASAGGQVSSGESYEQAAVRELHEELGCPPGELELITRYNGYSPRQREKRALFLHRCDGPFHTDPRIVESLRYFKPDELEALTRDESCTGGFRRSLELYLAASRRGDLSGE